MFYKLLMILLLIAVCFILGMLCSGCMVIWTDQAFVYTCFKTVDANDLDIIAEPNYVQIGSGQTKTQNDSIKASAIIGGVPIVIESEAKDE